MEKGRIIFLNGVTSTGKTSIAKAMQKSEDIFFYVLSNDMFEETVGYSYLQTDYWRYLGDAIFMMYHTAKLFSDMGKNVIIDGMLFEKTEISSHYPRLLEIMKDYPFDIVEVSCPLEICRQRNIARGDRYENQSIDQHKMMTQGVRYSVRVETDLHSPDECADIIISKLFSLQS